MSNRAWGHLRLKQDLGILEIEVFIERLCSANANACLED